MIKKLLPLFLFVLVVFIFIPNNASSATSCSDYEGTSKVICGPESPSGNGEILWKNKTENVGDLTVFQAVFNLRENSQVNMKANSTLIFDAGGCNITANKCSSSDPKDRDYYSNILELDKSSLFHGGGINAYVYMKDNVHFKILNDSNLTLGYVREKEIREDKGGGSLVCPTTDGCYTKLNISVKDSNLAIGEIIFENPDSWLERLMVENDEKNRGKYNVNINNGIKVSEIRFIDLKNADVTIGGDVIAYGKDGKGGSINPINLDNSDLVLKGNLISQVQAVLLTNKSIFKIAPSSGIHTLEMGAGGRPVIQVESGSNLIAQDIKSRAADIDLVIRDENTEFSADKIYFDKDNKFSFNEVNISVSMKAKTKINTIDTRLNCGSTCGTSTQKVILSATDNSTLEVGEIIFNSNATTLNLNNSYGKIGSLNYYNNEVHLQGIKTDNVAMNIGSINLLNDNVIYDIEFIDQNIKVDSINLKKTDKLDFNINNSFLDLGNITCGEYCQKISFKGSNDSTINLTNFSSGATNSADASNTFNNIKMNVSDNYNSNGTFEATDSTLNFGSIKGEYESINLKSSHLSINKASAISLTSGAVNIGVNSSFIIKGEQIFENKDSINIVNDGLLDMQSGNNFNNLTNNIGATAKLNGTSSINTIDNLGILELYTGATMQDLYNQGKLLVYGENRIEKYSDDANAELMFYVANKTSKPSLIIGEMDAGVNLKNLSIKFDSLAVIRPGLSNRYNLIKTEKGSIGIDYDTYSKLLRDGLLPPWLIHDEKIDFNNGEDSSNGETAWISIQRLTNYTNLIKAVPNYGDDTSILTLAGSIDKVVFNSRATVGLEDVVNSLDLNSGCTWDERLIYEIHQGVATNIDISNSPCLYTMAKNMNKLKPISNEVYALYSHTNTIKSIDTLLEANREYVYSGEIYSWYKGDIGYTNLANKGKDTGFKSINSMVYVGATIAPYNNYNFSGILGIGVGNLKGNKNLYDGTANSITAGLAGSYLKGTYFVSLSSVVGLTNFDTNRNIDFLDNKYSGNRETKSTAKLSVLEIALKLEAGDEYIVNSTTFLTPKIFLSQSVLKNSGYEEFGSSASLNVDANTLLMSDVGIGIELRRELLLPRFLGINKAFWYPKIGVNIVERFYQNPSTSMKFVGTGDDFYDSIDSANYSGILGQLYTSLLYQDQSMALQVGYNGEVSLSGYMNHSINATLKYSFK